jgi:hypothetical protein
VQKLMATLTQLDLTNFRGFDQHAVPFRSRTWVVGRNNAGKTSLITALTLVSRVTNRWGRLVARPVPEWLADAPVGAQGVSPAITDIDLPINTLFHHYAGPPASIKARFSDESRVDVYVGPDGAIWAAAFDASGRAIPTHGSGATRRLPSMAVLPQVAPLQESEKILDAGYVRRSLGSSAASLHFRNQLFRDLVQRDSWEGYEEGGSRQFDTFKRLAEDTWPGLQIRDLEWEPGHVGTPLRLNVRDGDFVAEAADMGHGLQMWLQVMWFLARSATADIIVLDEPEVYTHADIQHRLVRVLHDRPNSQVIVATHSVEVLNDVDPEEVLVVDRTRPRSGFAGSVLGLQRAMERLGGVGSLPLTRLWAARRVLLVEGDDVDYLALFHRALFPASSLDLRTIPRVPVGGWGGFSYALGGGMLLRNAAGEEVVPYCVLDSDYHTTDEISGRYAEAARAGVELHIWNRKEIESYLLSPAAIRRLIKVRRGDGVVPSEEEIAAELDRLADELRNDVTDRVAEALLHKNRGWGPPRANQEARTRVSAAWQTRATRWGICNAKDLLSGTSTWAGHTYDVNFSPLAVAHHLHAVDLPSEVRNLMSAIDRGVRLSGSPPP